VVSDDEKEIGVAVIDIGGGTTDVIQYLDGAVAHASVIPAGGNNVTSDVAAGLRTPMGEAERLKRNYGCALGRMVADHEEIEVPGVGGHPPRRVSRRMMSDIIEPRIEEIFAEARRRMEETGLVDQMSSGVVLTGGAVLMEGMAEAAEEILGMPVRLGFPVGVKGIVQLVQGPQYAASVGLVRYGAAKLADLEHAREPLADVVPIRSRTSENPRKLWNWLKEAF
jgi:cell division protein FtsA